MQTPIMGPRAAVRVPDGFVSEPYHHIEVVGCGPTIGAFVSGIQLSGDLDATVIAEIRQALLEWKVLFFRDQMITRDEHRAFAQLWGELEQHPFFKYTQPGQTDTDVVTLAKDALTGGRENEWHTDITWHTNPSFGAVLRAVEVPEFGGDTLWADAAAAYDTLPRKIRDQIDPLTAVHDWRYTFGLGMPTEAFDKLSAELPPVQHPVVRVHPETGRKTLFVNPIFTQHIAGLDPAASEALLARLYWQITRPECQVRFRWEPGSVAFWDNRATQHYAASDYHPQRRVMDRISIAGDRTVGPRDPVSSPV